MLAFFSIVIFFFSLLIPGIASENLKHWCSEEARVRSQAREENKPIVLAFVGLDFCPWSQKMASEILGQDAFFEKIGGEAILWKYALHSEGNPKEDSMRSKYQIEECPTILILDPQGVEFARYGYLPLEPKVFAEQILEVIADFKEICIALNEPLGKQDVKRWSDLYARSRQFSSSEFKRCVLERGIEEDPGTDFLMEQYIFLLERHKLKSPVVKKCKAMLVQKDPENCFGTHFKIAIADFHKYASEKKGKKHVKKILHPLVSYLECFGDKDKDNAWNAEMMIANYLFSLHAKHSALEFAKKAYQHAPESHKQNVAETIAYMNQ